MKTCTLPDCSRIVVAKGLCASHYQAKRSADARAAVRARSRPCVRCGRDLAGKRPNAIYCSRECKLAATEEQRRAAVMERLAARICVQCGNAIPAGAGGKAQTCSRACGVAWQNAKRRALQVAAWEARKQPCPQCGKELDNFRSRATYCSRQCKRNANSARWRVRSPGYMRQRLYGISPEQFAERLEAQDGRCAICRTDTPGGMGGWHVDHDHETQAVRGLLCHACNVALGNFNDDPARLRAAVAYLTG